MSKGNPRHCVIEPIFVKRPHPQSRAFYIKMRGWYKGQDKGYRFQLGSSFRKDMLKERLKKIGVLTCDYCGKGPLLLDSAGVKHVVRKEWLATIDHIKAKSQNGRPYDPDNVRIACPKCNQEKGDMNEEEFMAKRMEQTLEIGA